MCLFEFLISLYLKNILKNLKLIEILRFGLNTSIRKTFYLYRICMSLIFTRETNSKFYLIKVMLILKKKKQDIHSIQHNRIGFHSTIGKISTKHLFITQNVGTIAGQMSLRVPGRHSQRALELNSCYIRQCARVPD